jgi:hypothetical protein
LWQILGAVNPNDQSQLFNPIVNAKEAVLKYQTQGLGAWVTYTSGAYKQFLKTNVGAATGAIQASSTSSSTTSAISANPSTVLNEMGELFHGIASGLNWAFWMFEPGQGWRFAMGVGGVASGAAAAKLYTPPSVSQEKSAAFPAAILLSGVSLLCLYMTLRAWPVDADGGAIRPAAYAVEILQGAKPEAGPRPTDNTGAIQAGLEAIASIWVVNKVVSAIGGEAGAAGVFGSIWNGIKSVFGSGEDAAGDAIEDTALTITPPPGLNNSGGSGTQLV